MKPANIRTKNIVALLLAIVMAMSLAACGGSPYDTGGIPDVGETMIDPAPEGLGDRFSGWGTNDDDDDDTSTAGEAKDSKARSAPLSCRDLTAHRLAAVSFLRSRCCSSHS